MIAGPSGSWRVNVVYQENKRFTSQKGVRKTAVEPEAPQSALRGWGPDGSPNGDKTLYSCAEEPLASVTVAAAPLRSPNPSSPCPFADSPRKQATHHHFRQTKTATSLRPPKKFLSVKNILSASGGEPENGAIE
ncbi:hypothetical protein B0T13DRAFT_513260 [Neurospora crassa]|nr:hypothetical protein B0T13DRAFT_513260 [Neurospora crassa]